MYISPERMREFDRAQRDAKTAWRRVLITVPVGFFFGIAAAAKVCEGQNYTWAQEAETVFGIGAAIGVLAGLCAATLLFLDRIAKRNRRVRPDGSVQSSPVVLLLGLVAAFFWAVVLCIILLVLIQYHVM